MKAKKSLGQNFLTAPHVVATMIHAGKVTKHDLVIEIGPGKGALTKKLLEQAKKVLAIEMDRDLVIYLEEKFASEIADKKLILISGDALDFSIQDYLEKGESWKLIANIPYYITGAILRKFLSENPQPSDVVLLMQKEVAERIVKRDGKQSILALSVELYGEAHFIKKVSPASFSPAPKIDSAILHINNLTKKHCKNTAEEDRFFQLVKTGFGHKRKTLKKNLQAILTSQEITALFETCHLPEKARAEEVSFPQWICLMKNS